MAIPPLNTSGLCFIFFLFPKMMPAIRVSKTLPCDVSVDALQDLSVDCSNRRLPIFPNGIPVNTTNLTLSINHIKNITQANFEHLENLVEIDFRCNCMPITLGPKDHVCNTSLHIQSGTFEKLTKLKSLYLDGNQLSEIPRGLPPNLYLLSLEANSIVSINREDMEGLENIEILLLGKNCYFRNRCNVGFQINNTTFQDLKKLTVLSLKANNLTSIPQNLPRTLKKLYLHANRIEEITEHDLNYLQNLELLDLSGNCPRCHNAPYPCEPCYNNKSILISPTAFASLKQLKFLRLHSTSLRKVDPKWFENTANLEVLDLSQNYLAGEIEDAQFLNFLPNLLDLDLSFNYDLQKYPSYLNLSHTFSKLTRLKYLRLRGYVFKTLNWSALKYLKNLINLTELDLGTNFIRNVNLNMFKDFPALQIINLSFNKISPLSDSFSEVPFYSSHVPLFGQYKEMHYFIYDQYSRSCSSKDQETNYSLPHGINPSCTEHGKTLDLSRNNMFFIHPSDFKDLASLKCLNLSGNAMSQTLHGTEFGSLSGLKYLDFSNNRVDLLYSNAFQELKELETLDLSDNKNYFQAEGVTHMLNFTSNMLSLKTLIMNGNEISTSSDKGMASSSITTLEFRKNRLDVLWRDGTEYLAFFKELERLEKLDISDNSLRSFPTAVFAALPPLLKQLNLSNNKLNTFDWEKLNTLKNLEILDLSHNQLTTISCELPTCFRTLKNLTLRHNWIKKLDNNFLQGASQLRYLDLSFNKIRTIRNSCFPENVTNNLDKLLLNDNPFKCDCDIVWLAWWINRTNVVIPRLATDVTCAGPGAWKGQSVVSLDLHTCEMDYSQILYCVSTPIIMTLMMFTVTSHLYFWNVWYIYHFCIAKIKGYKRLFSSEFLYDAFVAYDIKDAAVNEWVLKELVEKLENEQEKRFNLCLEERDWLPGQPVLDNLSESIEMSRKTVFVLTNRYIACGNFRTAFYLAHQRLMDEKIDVIVLIFLEKVLQKSKYLRLRKRLCSRSVLEWPTNPQSQRYFWQCLKNAIAANNDVSYNILFKEMV